MSTCIESITPAGAQLLRPKETFAAVTSAVQNRPFPKAPWVQRQHLRSKRISPIEKCDPSVLLGIRFVTSNRSTHSGNHLDLVMPRSEAANLSLESLGVHQTRAYFVAVGRAWSGMPAMLPREVSAGFRSMWSLLFAQPCCVLRRVRG